MGLRNLNRVELAMTESLTVSQTERSEQQQQQEPVMQSFCPHCGADRSGRRSRIRWFDLPLLLVFVRPVRCTDCYSRYYRFVNSPSSKRP